MCSDVTAVFDDETRAKATEEVTSAIGEVEQCSKNGTNFYSKLT